MSNNAKNLWVSALCGATTVALGNVILGPDFSMGSWFLGTLNGAFMGLSAMYFGGEG